VVALAAAAAVAVWCSQVWWPYRGRVELQRAIRLRRQWRWPAAAMAARRARARAPGSVAARYELCKLLMGAGRYEAARAALRELEAFAPHYADVDQRVAVVEALRGQMDAARAALDLARRYDVAWGEFAGSGALSNARLRELAREFVSAERRGRL
jgi:predicted Zn-dependent protease